MIGAGLVGRTALVTGTAHGIGAAIAAALSDEGATVYGIDKLDSGSESVNSVVDVSDRAAVEAFVATLPAVDILVNNAGGVVGQTHQAIEDVPDDAWRAVLDANLTSAFVCTRAVVPRMKAGGWGRIVTISSGAGRSVSLTGIQAYTTAKAAQIGFTRQMAYELGPFGITVNCIAPGFVLSNPTTQKQWESYGPDGQAELVQGIALRRLGSAEDIAGGVRWFTSEFASWVTGQVISIDGGHAIF